MVKLYFEHFKLYLKSQLEYKASFIMNSFSQFIIFFTQYFVIVGLFQKFSNIKGFNVYEVLLCFGIIHFGFTFNETFFRGIDKFENRIINGSLDRFLVRPQGILFQVLCDEIDLVKIFRFIQSIIIIIIAIVNLNIKWNLLKIISLLLMLLGSIIIFLSMFILMASYCFVTIQALEIKNLMTDGSKFIAQYPIGIYKKTMAIIFTYILPFAFINYYPLLYFVNRSNNILYMLSPLISVVFLLLCLLSFKIGMKHYNSVGS